MGPDSRNDFRTGEEAIVDDDISECRYERKVSLFFSRASLEELKPGCEGDGTSPSVLYVDCVSDIVWTRDMEGEVGLSGAAGEGALTVDRSLTGGARMGSSG